MTPEPVKSDTLVRLSDDTDWKAQQELPEEETNRTFVELGLEKINVKKLRAYKKISNALKVVGMVEYERGQLVGRQCATNAAIEAMAALALSDGDKHVRVSAALALKELVAAANKTAELNIKLEELHKETSASRKMDSGLPPMAQQVNVYTQNGSVDVKKATEAAIVEPVT